MPKVTLSLTAPTDALIVADANRVHLEFSASADCRYCAGAAYAADDSQPLRKGEVRIYTGASSKLAFSFSDGKETEIHWIGV